MEIESGDISKGYDIRIERFHFSVRLGSIFFPFDLADIQPVLEKAGYTVRKEIVDRMVDMPLGARLVAGGAIAEKADTKWSFRTDPDRGIIALIGPGDISGIIDDFINIEKLIKEQLIVDLEKEANFYEFITEGAINTGNDPIKAFANLYKDSGFQAKADEIIGISSTNYGVRIVERGKYPNENSWLDYRIEPLVPKPNSIYHINVVFRDPEKQKVINTAQSLIGTLQSLISAIEKQG